MLAYSLSVHKNPGQVSRLMNSLYTSEDFYYINIFGADSHNKQAEWMNHLKSFEKSNVFFSFKYTDSWGTIDQVKANIDAMIQFKNLNYSFFINLSGQCYPIKSIRLIKEDLSENKYSYIAFNKMPEYCKYANDKTIYFPPNTKYYYRFEYCYYPVPNWYLIQLLKGLIRINKDIKRFIRIPRIRKNFLYTHELYKGSNWFCLHKDHVNYLLDYLMDHPDYIKFFSTVFCSDEHFFQTILLNSPLKSQIVNDNLRYIIWDNATGSPMIFSLNHCAEILGSQKHFARKFDTEIDSAILDAIDLNIKN